MLTQQRKRVRRRLHRYGAELDGSGLLCARVQETGESWQLSLDHLISPCAEQSEPSWDVTGISAAAGSGMTELAIVLPMEHCDVRVMELPQTNDNDELRTMIRSELDTGSSSSDVFDFWKLPAGMAQQPTAQGVCVISTSVAHVQQATEKLKKSGITVIGIDGLPTAASRAIGLMSASFPEMTDQLRVTMAVHIGWNRTTLILISDGIPILVRVPRLGGLGEFLKACLEPGGSNTSDLLRILRGIHRGLPVRVCSRLLSRWEAVAKSWMVPVCEEVLRSVGFARRPGLRQIPRSVVLMGVGSVIPGLPAMMSEQLNIDVGYWELPTASGSNCSSEHAIAAAMSAWEAPL